VPLPKTSILKDKSKVIGFPGDTCRRAPVQVSLGCHVEGAALPHPDLNHTPSNISGAAKRILVKLPDPDRELLNEFKEFVLEWVRNNLNPISPDTDLSVEAWLDKTDYTLARKEQLKAIKANLLDRYDVRIKNSKSFIKRETYGEPKYPRTINSRTDEFKVLVGPIFKAIEKQVFQHEAFIKLIPLPDRPAYIKRVVHQYGAEVIASDYTSFESAFIRKIQESCEMILYEYMVELLGEQEEFKRMLSLILGEQKLIFKTMVVKMVAIRLSGEMCTSLGNGFSNLMLCSFLAKKNGCKSFKGVVEGDDGLFSYYGHLDGKMFERLGFVIKLEHVENLCEASFCGMIFDESDLVNVTNPIDCILSLGWTDSKYRCISDKRLLELLRCKGLSMKYQYNGCPIIDSLADYALRVTRGIAVRYDKILTDTYKREQFKYIRQEGKIPKKEIGINTRYLVERKFKINVETQIRIENYLNSLEKLSVIDFPLINDLVTHHSANYWNDYVRFVNTMDPDCCFPCLPNDINQLQLKDCMQLYPGVVKIFGA